MLDVIITSPAQKKPIPLRNVATLRRNTVASEVTHQDLQTTLDITMNVHERDLGHVADEVMQLLHQFGSYSNT